MVGGSPQATAGTFRDRMKETLCNLDVCHQTTIVLYWEADTISPTKTGLMTLSDKLPIIRLPAFLEGTHYSHGCVFTNEEAKIQTGMSLLRTPDAGSRI